ncbi:MAG: tetratricopeptide repeat protein, partial [Bacteroidia bacterium]|nr:tetratricopeptide repeat protein [Bacteroidia bacterium]
NKDKDAIPVTDNALELSLKTGNTKGALAAKIGKGSYDFSTKNYESAEKRFRALKIQLDTTTEEFPFERGRVYYYLARIIYDRGEPTKALSYFEKAIPLLEKSRNKRFIGVVYNMTGLSYWNLDKPEKALEFFIKSSELKRETKDSSGLAASLGNIGLVYGDLKLYDKSIKYHRESIAMNKEIGNVEGMANEYTNIGIVYYMKKTNDSAEFYVRKALELGIQEGDKNIIARCYNNLGLVYDARNNLAAALSFYEKSLKLKEETNNPNGLSSAHVNIGAVQMKRKNFSEAEKHMKLAFEFGKTAESLERQREAAQGLFEVYEQTNKTVQALEWYKLATQLKDSVFNENNNKIIAEMNEKFESDQKDRLIIKKNEEALAQQLKFEKEHRQNEKQKTTIIYFVVFSLVAIVLSIIMLWAFLQKRKGNKVLATKNAAIEAQKQEITDSINYAKRIQQAILPAAAEMKVLLPDHAIFYRPKDIVAGDFYWFTVCGQQTELKNFQTNKQTSSLTNEPKTENLKQETVRETLLLGASDCTGHGVPGAFMSLIGKENLDKAAQRSSSPAEILSHLNKFVKSALQQSSQGESMQDGMDISIIALQQNAKIKNEGETTTIKFSGANRPLWILNNTNGKNSLQEIKGTKAAIGGYTPHNQVYEEHEITIEKNDSLYLFTDGFPDQFGGPKEKKLTTKRFRSFLMEICHLTATEQMNKIDEFFTEWKRNIEQIDDVLVIVLKF